MSAAIFIISPHTYTYTPTDAHTFKFSERSDVETHIDLTIWFRCDTHFPEAVSAKMPVAAVKAMKANHTQKSGSFQTSAAQSRLVRAVGGGLW